MYFDYNRIYKLLDLEKFEESRGIIYENLNINLEDINDDEIIHQIRLCSILIDLGRESFNENDLQTGINFYLENKSILQKSITKSSFYYNLANAKEGLARIFYSKNKGVHSIYKSFEKFQEPINLYWMAFKKSEFNDSLYFQIIINLSNALITTHRIIEALQFLDTALKVYPDCSQALVSRASYLDYLSTVTNCKVSITLYIQIFISYSQAVKNGDIPNSILHKCLVGMSKVKAKIQSNGFSLEDIEQNFNKTKAEYNQLSEFRKFSINNFLSLNEHAIYCPCISSRTDNLQIGIKGALFKNSLLPKLELLLNRIKSEFAFARWNFYKYNTERAFDYDVEFSELLEGEVINSRTETLRTSYRICYGILDKIALGICKIYEIDEGNIYFEKFWNDKKKKNKLESQKNIHLNALYSIASDLNTRTGELRHFKNWRNKLEHNLLILKDTEQYIPDPFNIYSDPDFVVVVDIEEFREKALHLLQLTRAAIFSYVYCIRLETITNKTSNVEDDIPTISLKHKL